MHTNYLHLKTNLTELNIIKSVDIFDKHGVIFGINLILNYPRDNNLMCFHLQFWNLEKYEILCEKGRIGSRKFN